MNCPRTTGQVACILQALLFFALCCTQGISQNYDLYKPKLAPGPRNPPSLSSPNDPAQGVSDQILVPRLDALVILDTVDKVNATHPLESADGIYFQMEAETSLLYSEQARAILNRYVGLPITLRRLNELSRDLIQFYRTHDQPVVDVLIPEQNITAGSVQIVVVEAKIGAVRLDDSYNSDAEWLLKKVRCSKPGAFIYQTALREDLYWLNRSPFRRVDLELKPGSQKGTTDILFHCHEVRPLRGYMGYEDTGVRSLALERIIAGFTRGNVFGKDGSFGYQFTADPQLSLLQAHAANFHYEWNHDWAITSFGSIATTNPDLPPPLNQNGQSWQTGGVMRRYLNRSSSGESSLFAGFDFKSTNNNLEFGGTSVQQSNADLQQLRFGYDCIHQLDSWEYWRLNHNLAVGPGGGFSHRNTNQAFETIRSGTRPYYWYYQGVGERLWHLPNDSELRSFGTWQGTSDRLLFSEMLGFGGIESVRGYDQRTVNGDCGWIANFEWGPRTKSVDWFHADGRFKAFAFSDFGQAFINQPVSGEVSDRLLAGVGAGVRYTIAHRLAMRCDYGHAILDTPGLITNDRLHISLVSFFGPIP